jgi:hypothetical protein
LIGDGFRDGDEHGSTRGYMQADRVRVRVPAQYRQDDRVRVLHLAVRVEHQKPAVKALEHGVVDTGERLDRPFPCMGLAERAAQERESETAYRRTETA